MSTTKFKLKFGNFELEMEGEQEYIDKKFTEVSDKLFNQKGLVSPTLPIQFGELTPNIILTAKPDLEGIIEYATDGKPRLTVPNPVDRLSQSNVMMIFLYAYEPQKLSITDMKVIVSDNWKTVTTNAVNAVMATTLKGRVIKEGTRGKFVYSLSGAGRDYVKNIIMSLKKKENEKAVNSYPG